MQVIDASSMIYAWDNYPIEQFPGLWDWMAEQIAGKELVMPSVAYHREVKLKAPDCADWLRRNDIELLPAGDRIVQLAFRIKELIGIVEDNYHPEGVDEKDLFIVATAAVHGSELISDERVQTTLPLNMQRYKIPAVCAMPVVRVPCTNFIGYIKRSGKVFR